MKKIHCSNAFLFAVSLAGIVATTAPAFSESDDALQRRPMLNRPVSSDVKVLPGEPVETPPNATKKEIDELRDAPTATLSGPCPYDCNSQGYSKVKCREWRKGKTCFIGPKSQAAAVHKDKKAKKSKEPQTHAAPEKQQ